MLHFIEDYSPEAERERERNPEDYRRILAMAGPIPVAKIVTRAAGGYWSYKQKPWLAETLAISSIPNATRKYGFPRYDHLAACDTVAEAKQKIEAWYKENAHLYERKSKVDPKYLPAGDNAEFFPTPGALAGRMLKLVNWRNVRSILEPSAGKGDLADHVYSFLVHTNNVYLRNLSSEGKKGMIDVIELDPNLQCMLLGKEYRLVGDDFLALSTRKQYDLIIMNPPFSNGDEHLLKAISMVKATGGQVVCLLNAETIRDPYSKRRKYLRQELSELNARIEFVKDGFKKAERSTDVEVAIVYIAVDEPKFQSSIWDGLKKAQAARMEEEGTTALVSGNWVEGMVAHYNMEADAGVALMKEYNALAPYILNSKSNYASPLIQLSVNDRKVDKADAGTVNTYLEKLRYKYWTALLDRPEVTGRMTSQMRDDYSAKLRDMAEYDFSLFNARRFLSELYSQLSQGVVDSIHELFETFSAKHSYYPECSRNTWYYNGWKTNKAHKVGMKVIIPVNGCYAESWKGEKLDSYRVSGVISDLERVLDYLDSGRTTFHTPVDLAIKTANINGLTKAVFTYFTATFYKKGTCHIKFHENARHLIDRLNIFAGREKGWLPPNYGKVPYDQMDAESRAVVDDFQGKEDYERIYAEAGYYLADAGNNSGFLALTGEVA